jgi:hypothetical protein
MPGRLLLLQRGCQATRKQPLGCLWSELPPGLFMPVPDPFRHRSHRSGKRQLALRSNLPEVHTARQVESVSLDRGKRIA